MSGPPDPRPSIRQAHKDLTRSRIADAARACFYEKGVMATSFEEIAAKASVRRATVYLHFSNKNAILAELLSQNLDAVRRIYERLLAIPKRDVGTVRKWLESYVRAITSHREALRLFQVAVAADDAVRHLIETHRETVLRSLGTAYPAFAAATGRIHAIALLMIIEIDFVADAAARAQPRLEVAASLDLLAERLSAMLLASEAEVQAW